VNWFTVRKQNAARKVLQQHQAANPRRHAAWRGLIEGINSRMQLEPLAGNESF